MRKKAVKKKAAIVGGGAAGFFAAIRLAELQPDVEVTIFEKSNQLLSKVKVSGGGRCNVTHACFDPRELVKFYPRGSRELMGPFNRFAPGDTISWFDDRGVTLKTEEDGRMFPITDSSQTIITTFLNEAHEKNIIVRTQSGVIALETIHDQWKVTLQDETVALFDVVMIATGSSPAVWQLLQSLGLKMVEPVPSLFTFNIKDRFLYELAGISVEQVSIHIPGTKLKAEGPLLFTHWGMSGPAILKLSAWGARILKELRYDFPLSICFLTDESDESLTELLKSIRHAEAKKQVSSFSPIAALSKRHWNYLLQRAGIDLKSNWADLSNKDVLQLMNELLRGNYRVQGKSTFKDEFVTCGGVALEEINFKTYEALRLPGLYFGGEVIDIDAITGGFNFQHAWTSGWIAAEAMSERLSK
ncbi:MAG: NAD(P)/FAD-dependent oxidoreductase [Bacteroidetes bacterium]|nr:NAD(P)/FAD-dependent oxidoreductase [Bacteroidota bacterium]